MGQASSESSEGCVLAVDDHAAFRQAVRRLIAAVPTLRLVGEADSGEAAVELAQELDPDVVLMDVRMPGMGGIAAADAIKAMSDSTVVVLVSAKRPDELPPEATDSSADVIVWKGELRAKTLEELWQKHRRGPGR